MSDPTLSDDFAAPGVEPPHKAAVRQLLIHVEADERWAIPRDAVAALLRGVLNIHPTAPILPAEPNARESR